MLGPIRLNRQELLGGWGSLKTASPGSILGPAPAGLGLGSAQPGRPDGFSGSAAHVDAKMMQPFFEGIFLTHRAYVLFLVEQD